MKKYPLLQAQLGVFLECQSYPDGTQYNLPFHTELDLQEDPQALADAWKKLILANAVLRDRFEIGEDGMPLQWPDDEMAVDIPIMKMTETEAQQYISKSFVRPFDLTDGSPLFRVEFIVTDEKLHMLTDFHHLIMDGLSYTSIFERNLGAFLNGKEKTADLSFFEIAENEHEYFATEEYAKARDYFVNMLSGEESSSLSSVSSASGQLTVSAENIGKDECDKWCSDNGTDAQTLFQAAFAVALGRMTRSETPVYCTSYHGRVGRGMMRSLGMFVNNVALKTEIKSGSTVRELLGAVRSNTSEAYTMGRFPFPHLNREIGIVPGVSFNYRPFRQYMKINGKKYPVEEIMRGTVQTDINVHIENIGDDYVIVVESSDAVNSPETVKLFAGAIHSAVINMMETPDADLGDIALVDKEEAKRIIALSAGERKEIDTSKTWLDHFKAQVGQRGACTAVVDENGSYTYEQLDRLSDSVAAYLTANSVKPDDFIALRTTRTKDFMAAVLGIWKAGAAYIPIDLDYPEERVNYILSDSGAKMLLDDEGIKTAEKTEANGVKSLAAPDSYAYIIYTSGSTGKPKGVVIRQRNLLNLAFFIKDRWGHTEKSRIACHSNFAFDASVEDLYPVLMAGGILYIVPESVRRDILLMRGYIIENGITGGCYTTQFGQLLGDCEEPIKLDYIVLGGEKMTAVPNITGKVINTYGPTEFTVDATYCEVVSADAGKDIPIGRALDNCSAYILDDSGNLLPQGAVGELCLSGPQIAAGYWNLPEKTAEVFRTVRFADGEERSIYRTGDLARYNSDDQLEYFGRIDFQVKLHGFRIELGEIDTRAMAFEGIRQAVSQVKNERIILYYVSDGDISEDSLRGFLAETLAEYMIPSVYMKLGEMPMTVNGKVNLKALPEPLIQDAGVTAPETELEAQILSIVKNVLGFSEIGVTTNLVSSGMSSLDTMRLCAGLSKELGSTFRVSDIMKDPTVRGIASLEEHNTGESSKLRHYPRSSSYPITENQRGVYLDWEMNSDTTQYNMPAVYLFRDTSADELKNAVSAVFDAHGYLKMRLAKISGEVVQVPHDDEPTDITVTALDTEPDTKFFQDHVKPFDLLADKLYRAEIFTNGGRTWLFLDIHHLICDGLSSAVLFDDLINVLKGGKPSEEKVTAYDYAVYEKEFLSDSASGLAEQYFEDLISKSQSVAYPDSEKPDNTVKGTAEFRMKQETVNAFCKEHNVTPGSYFQAAFALLLKRLTREDRPLYLTVSSGRSDVSLSDTVGMFVKTLPAIYMGKDASETSVEYVEDTHRQLQEIYSREMVPYTALVEDYNLHSEVLFAYQGGISDEVEGAELIPLSLDMVKFPVMVTVYPDGDSYRICVEYDGMRYSNADMQHLARAVAAAASGLAMTEKLYDVCLVDAEETKELIELGTGETLERDESETILDIFRKRVAATPDAPALVFHEKRFTYKELDEISDRLAVYLEKTTNIGAEENVGVLINRSELMLIYPLAVMKTGAAYMPLDPHFPTDRLAFMCEDASVRLILSEDDLIEEKLPDYKGERFYSRSLSDLPAVTEEDKSILKAPHTRNRFVIIFTSGTTGKPKAVELEHYGIVNFCHWYVTEFALTMEDRVAGYANFGFDAHMIDLYPSILAGSCIYLFDEGMRMDILAMNDYMEENKISVGFMTTQIGCLISEMNHSLRYLSTGGEKMPPVNPPEFRFLNVYGPTECSLFSTFYDVPGYFEGRLIGRPLMNYQLYIIDQTNKLVPRGARGELLIAGQGVARGYMNRPELNAEKFIDFKPLPDAPAVKAYRSGDLVSWDDDGNIVYLGRIDKQVKLRGLRIELGEIENRVLSYPGITQAVVDVKGKNPQLCCFYISENEIDIDDLKKFLSETLTDFMVPQIYMRLEDLPLNANGKVDRRAIPEPETVTEEIIAPETEDEKKVFDVTADVLGITEFGVTTNLISQGMSSIAAMRLAAALEDRLGIKMRVAEVLKNPTVRDIANFGKSSDTSSAEDTGLKRYPGREYYPITENQRGIYLDWEMNPDTTQYNIPNVYVFTDITAEKLADAVRTAVGLHPYLKTRLVNTDEDIMQQPHADESVDIEITALTECPDAEFFQKLIVPFDIMNDKLYRFRIFTFEQQVFLFSDIHHIIYDGLSTAVFLEDLYSVCKGDDRPAETVTAYDYAVYEQDYMKSEAFAATEKYFDDLVDGVTSASYPSSEKPDLTGASDGSEPTVGTLFERVDAAPIDEFCKRYAVTAGNYLQAAVAELLYNITNEDKPMYLTISNGRSADSALQNTVGMYVRTLPVVYAWNNPNHAAESVAGYVQAVQKQLQMTFEREIYPYTRLVERHRLHADVMVAWQGGVADDRMINDAKELPLTLDAVKFPILITTYPEKDSYVLMLEYDRTRFGKEDMEHLLSCIAKTASSMARAGKIGDISMGIKQRGFKGVLDKLPMKSGGKIDVSALPEFQQTSSAVYTEPETPEEKVIAESMQKVLGSSDPVGALDSFFEIGGDSIKAIRMVSLIRQKGYVLRVSDIMNLKTVRAIAGVLQAKESSSAISQQAFTGAVPDSAITAYFRYLELPEPQHFNQSTLWQLSDKPGTEMLQKAIDAVVAQHDMLRAVYNDDGLFVRPADAQITIKEYDAASREEITKLCGEIQASIDMKESLVKAALIHQGEDDYLFLAVHHLVIDGVSWRVIASDLETAVASLRKGEKAALPMKTNTYNDYSKALEKYRDSSRLAQEMPYWENVQKELMLLPYSHEKDHSRQSCTISALMDEAATQSFIKANFGMMNAEINDALLTAVGMSYAAMTGDRSVSVQLEGHGREDIGETLVTDRTVGWFTSIFPVVLKNISTDLGSTFVEVKEALHRIPNKGVGYNVLRFISGKTAFTDCGDSVARISFNYLGEMDSEQEGGDSFLITTDIDTGAAVSPKNVFGCDLSINAAVENGKFGLYVRYNTAVFDKEQMEKFAEDILANMTGVAQYLSGLTEKQITATDLGENEWSSHEFADVVEDFAMRDEKLSRIYPLTPMQEGMLFKYLSDPKAWAYKIVTVFELNVMPTEEQLTAALERLTAKHEVLRTSIIYDGVKKPRQAIVERSIRPEMVDLSRVKNKDKSVRNLRTQMLNDAFELQRKPLFQVVCAKKSKFGCYILVAVHHIIVDGWCIGLYTGDLFSFLNEEITGNRTADSVPDNGKYEKAVRELLAKDKKEGLAYWRELLSGYETKAEIPSFGEVPLNEQSKNDAVLTTIDKEITDRFNALCSSEGATISNGIELAWGLVLQTYSRTDDAVFAKVVSGRDNTATDVNDLVGLFINSVPVRVKTGAETTVRQLLRELQAQAANSNKYDFCALSEIQQQTELGSDLFQNIIAFENYDSGLEDEGEAEYAFTVDFAIIKEENFDEVTPAMYIDKDGQLCLNLTFNRRHYRREEIEAVGRLFAVLVEEMVKAPDSRIFDLPRLSEEQFRSTVELSTGKELVYDTSKTWLDLFDEQVKRAPDAEAVSDENSSMTYKELDTASDSVAGWLISQGVQVNDFVAVKMSRSKEFIAAIFGIQKAGAAYVPIDISYPPERIEYIEKDAEAKVVLTDDMMPELLAYKAEHINRSAPDNFAYMIYTSGSTGVPKGAVIYQKGLLNHTYTMKDRINYTPEDRISCHRSLSFDAHIVDYYGPLCSGSSVHIMPESIRKDPNRIYDFLVQHKITGGGYTTALAKIMKNGYPLTQRFLTCGGEALNGVVSDDVTVYNLYGPTECTCDIAIFRLERGMTYDPVPIGRPTPNCQCFIVDEHGNLLPQGVRGEICIAGAQVGYGYWKHPELTEAAFVDCPFIEGVRMYRTGDLGYYNKDGEIVYAGRIDFQVKLHGFRIELGEIESRAAQYSGIDMVCAQVRKDCLVLYYSSDSEIDTDALRKFLGETLTEYMVPTVYIHMDTMPLTPNGKINLKALPDPEVTTGMKCVPPENRLEENCLRIAKEILPGVEFGVTDDLTAAGMNSLSTMMFTSRITNELRLKVRVSDIMRYKTIRGIILGKRRISWLYEEYDYNKPTLVFIQGIVLLSDTAHLHELLSKYFNLIVIEPVQNHYNTLFQGEHYNEVVEFYLASAQLLIPENAPIFGFMGFSFGGELAFGMAGSWKKETGRNVVTIMGDSTLPESGKRPGGPELTSAQKLRELIDQFEHKDHEYTEEELETLADLTNMVHVICCENSLEPHDGRVIFLNACRNSTDTLMKNKMDALNYYAPNAEIHDFPDRSHSGIFSDEDLHPFYRELMEKLIGEEGQRR